MATHLDLEEQEQLDQLKHFWKTWGNLISGLALLVALGVAGWNGWQYYQRSQAARAAVLYDELDQAVIAGDMTRVDRAFADIKNGFGRTTYAQQAGLLAAKALADKGQADASRAALAWVADHGSDSGYQAIARLRLASALMDGKSWDEALKQLNAGMPQPFEALADDRRGDIYLAQGQRDAARAAYEKAWTALGAESPYRNLVAIKLTAVGVDAKTLAKNNS
jgi:predicted negative regulator of RcsB-dependent stress response